MSDVEIHDDDLPIITLTRESLLSHFEKVPTASISPTLFNPDYLTRRNAYQAVQSLAAVLIPIIQTDDRLYVLFTIRSQQLNNHAGQICFPGGRIDAHDVDAFAAALRESFEEINLPPTFVKPLGTLNHYLTGTGFRITPVIGLIEKPFMPQCNLEEVSATLTVPLDFLMNPANYVLQVGDVQNQHRSFYEITYDNHVIWGATAAILFGLYEALLSSHAPEATAL